MSLHFNSLVDLKVNLDGCSEILIRTPLGIIHKILLNLVLIPHNFN